MGLTPEQMGAAIIANLPKRTGRTLEEWVALVKSEGPQTQKEQVQWLKSAHGLGHVQAQVVAGEANKRSDYVPLTAQELLDGQYSERKAQLRPIYDRLAKEMESLGSDVVLDPRKTYVSATRRRQFAVIQPSTGTRVDLGLALPGVAPAGRLESAPSSLGSERITHRVVLTSPEEVDGEVIDWIKAAYELDG